MKQFFLLLFAGSCLTLHGQDLESYHPEDTLRAAGNQLLPVDPEEYDSLLVHIVSPGGKYGLASLKEKKILIPPVYDSLFRVGYYQSVFDHYSYRNGRQCWFNDRFEPLDLDSMEVMSTYELIYNRMSLLDNQNINRQVFIVRSPATGKAGIANAEGTVIIPPQYDTIHAYLAGYAASLNGKWGFLDSAAQTIIPFEYDLIMADHAGLVNVTLKGKKGLRSYSNEEIVPTAYDKINLIRVNSVSDSDYYIVYRAGRCGVVKSGGKIAVPLKYRSAEWIHTHKVVRLDKLFRSRIYNVELKRFIGNPVPADQYIYGTVGGVIVFSELGTINKRMLSDGTVLPIPKPGYRYY